MKLQTFLRGVLARWHLVQLAAKERDTQISDVGVDTLKVNEGGGSTLYRRAQIILKVVGDCIELLMQVTCTSSRKPRDL